MINYAVILEITIVNADVMENEPLYTTTSRVEHIKYIIMTRLYHSMF